jgi:hypothetical protein
MFMVWVAEGHAMLRTLLAEVERLTKLVAEQGRLK